MISMDALFEMKSALEWTGLLVLWAVFLQSIEMILLPSPMIFRFLNGSRALFSAWVWIGLLSGRETHPLEYLILALMTWTALIPYGGLFNGGSDAMLMMILLALAASGLKGGGVLALMWVGIISLLSYFISGLRKSIHADWWNGRALESFLLGSRISLYNCAQLLARQPWIRWVSPAVVLFQVFFPVAVLGGFASKGLLALGFGFHLSNFALFGLNRFFWVWMATYPCLVWVSQHGSIWVSGV
jgi:hypothetical protein